MFKTTLRIEGMACAMCEGHINDAVRRAVPAKKVTSSHKRGETVIITEDAVDEAALHAAIDPTGYVIKGILSEPYEKKSLFSFGK